MNSAQSPVILKLEFHNDSNIGELRRITGFVKMSGLITLITQEELEANPRHSKKTAITKDILYTLQHNPAMMPFYSKGLLIGSSEVTDRDRNRFQLEFSDSHREGILDGGHNALAIGIALLTEAEVPEKEINKIRVWRDLKECWHKNIDLIEKLKKAKASTPTLEALIPVEILSPSNREQAEDSKSLFNDLILSICANRNQNAQLAADAIANQSGAFDPLKNVLPENISKEVAWRTNDEGRLDPRFLVCLSWVTFAKIPTLSEYGISPLSGTSAYSSKAEALNRFTKLMEAEGATTRSDNGLSITVTDSYIASALRMVPQVLECYDLIYKGYRTAYNSNSGSFGRIAAVRKSSNSHSKKTLFSQEPISHEVPPLGYIMPAIFSLQALIRVDQEKKKLGWMVNPVEFFQNADNLKQIIGALKPIIEMADWDPQRIGKGGASYDSTREKARNMMLEAMYEQSRKDY
ncbi:hypothetical protein [Rothia sp. CCM 9419]|uniref:hypothetical protein n=1 Tax=Rothia sp. CCM 9419 TaxID=3402662 RepID=UPI003AE014B4